MHHLSEDHGHQLYQAFQSARASGTNRLKIPRGRYLIGGSFLREENVIISNNLSGAKPVLFNLSGLDQFEIDGDGAELVFDSIVIPFWIHGSSNIHIHNLTIDWKSHGFSEVVVQQSSAQAIEFTSDDQFAVQAGRLVRADHPKECFNDKLYNALPYDLLTKEPLSVGDEHWHLEKYHKASVLENDNIRLEGNWGEAAPPVGSGVCFMHGDRVAPAIAIDQSSEITISNITIHHALGMGILAQCSSDIKIEEVEVVPGKNRLSSTWCDATHFVDCAGQIEISKCRFEGMHDDGSNIHGTFYEIFGKEDSLTWYAKTNHPKQAWVQNFKPGDRIRFYDADTIQLIEECTLSQFEAINGSVRRLQFETAPIFPEKTRVVAMRYVPDLRVIIEGCTFRPIRGRGLLLSVPGTVLVRNNKFHTTNCAILSTCDVNHWNESGPIEDLIIEENHFDRCGFAATPWPVFDFGPELADQQLTAHSLGRIVIENNKITLAHPLVMTAKGVRELVFRKNRIDGSEGPLRPADCFKLGPALGGSSVEI